MNVWNTHLHTTSRKEYGVERSNENANGYSGSGEWEEDARPNATTTDRFVDVLDDETLTYLDPAFDAADVCDETYATNVGVDT